MTKKCLLHCRKQGNVLLAERGEGAAKVVLQEIEENLRRMEFRHLFYLGNHSKQPSDQDNLPSYIPFCDPLHLPFSHHVHHLISL